MADPKIVVHGPLETRIAFELGQEVDNAYKQLGVEAKPLDLHTTALMSAVAVVMARHLEKIKNDGD